MATSLTHLLPSDPEPIPAYARLLAPITLPIPLLQTPVARTYLHVHTALTVAYYSIRFSTLVADPLPTLIFDLTPLAILQCIFCAICLPPAGTWGSGSAIVSGSSNPNRSINNVTGSGTGSMRKKRIGVAGKNTAKDSEWPSKIMPTILSLTLTLLLPPLPLALLTLTMGAPIFPYTQLTHTLLLAVHVSLLAFMPIFYTHGVDRAAWRDITAAWLPFDAAGVWGGTVGSFIGGWIGAVPIALDWDREWQKWPCTVVVGVVSGWAVGRIVTGLGIGIGRRINLGEKEEEAARGRMKKSD